MSSEKSHWGLHKFSEQSEIRLEWERLSIRIIKRGSDLLLVENRGDTTTSIQLGSDPESDFRRYAFQNPVKEVRVQPRTPNRPLVLQPLHPLRLAPQARVDFYVSVPVDIQLTTGEKEYSESLDRIRGEILSDTWFGDPLSGLLCYAIKSRARRECPVIDTEKTVRALCKIQIHNDSNEQLLCRQFCLRLDHCHLWQDHSTIWTSPVKIRFKGGDHLSAIDYSEDPPEEAPDAQKIAEAEETPLSGLIRRTFAGFGNSFT